MPPDEDVDVATGAGERLAKIAASSLDDAEMRIAQIDWSRMAGWKSQWLTPPAQQSKLILALGSGGDKAKEWNERWKKSEVGGTSRAVFSGFCEHCSSGGDARTGACWSVPKRRGGDL